MIQVAMCLTWNRKDHWQVPAGLFIQDQTLCSAFGIPKSTLSSALLTELLDQTLMRVLELYIPTIILSILYYSSGHLSWHCFHSYHCLLHLNEISHRDLSNNNWVLDECSHWNLSMILPAPWTMVSRRVAWVENVSSAYQLITLGLVDSFQKIHGKEVGACCMCILSLFSTITNSQNHKPWL